MESDIQLIELWAPTTHKTSLRIRANSERMELQSEQNTSLTTDKYPYWAEFSKQKLRSDV